MADLNETPDTFAEQAIVELLNADDAPPQVAIVFGDRIYPVVLPDDAVAPALVYQQLEELTVSTKDGTLPAGYMFELALMAHDFATLKKGVRAVRNALNGKKATLDGIGELYFSFADESEPDYNDERKLHIIGLQFKAR